MKLILLSGGSGKRLWPLSNDSRSKQFLKVLKNPEKEMESMVQRVWRQLREAGLAEHAYVATRQEQADAIRVHLGPDVPLILEPERRDTFPAIVLSSVYLRERACVSPDETVCVVPVDCYVDSSFFERIAAMEDAMDRSGASLAVIGARPIYPSQKYGYLLPEKEGPVPDSAGYLTIRRFAEKPDEETARRFIGENALWNCGAFAFKLRLILSLLERNGWPSGYEELRQAYARLPKTSFDYEVAEKAEKIVALPYDGKWKDLGTWNTLTEEMDTGALGEAILSQDAADTHVVNELDIPVAVLGAEGLVVACSPDGILVARKTASHRLKELADRLPGPPRYEEHRWGWLRVLDRSEEPSGGERLVRKLSIRSGQWLAGDAAGRGAKRWIVLAGDGIVVLGEQAFPVRAGDLVTIPERAGHELRAVSHLEVIEIVTGKTNPLEEDGS